jgi:hypothetical protein
MSSLERAPAHLQVHRPVTLELALGEPASRELELAWRIGADALRAANPELARSVLGAAQTSAHDEVILTLRVLMQEPPALEAHLTGPRGSIPIATAGAHVHITRDPTLGLLHIDASTAQGPLLRSTVRTGTGPARALYCRTSLLQSLGLGGGRYEPHATRPLEADA